MVDKLLRDRISAAISDALRPLPVVFAGWEGGSAALDALDRYSDIDLLYLVDDEASFELLFSLAEKALETVSSITASHSPLRGRYYQLKDGGEFFLVDLIFVRAGDSEHFLEVERHGKIIPLFDKGHWLRPRALDEDALAIKREKRYRELQTWFPMSQLFVRKAILRGQQVEAVNAFWVATLKPLAELLRMRYCPVRWDFGVRYLDRDLPPAVYNQVRELVFVRDLGELEERWARATAWGATLLREFEPV